MTRKSKRELERDVSALERDTPGPGSDLQQTIPFALLGEWEERHGRDPADREDLLNYAPKK
jgi:hypothetical protein